MRFIKKLGMRVIVILFVFVLVWMAIDLNTRISTLHFLEDQEKTLEVDVSNLQATLDETNQRIDYAKSDTAVEEWARQQGLMMQEGDHIIIPLMGEYHTPTPSPMPEIQVTQAPNWTIWKSLIFD